MTTRKAPKLHWRGKVSGHTWCGMAIEVRTFKGGIWRSGPRPAMAKSREAVTCMSCCRKMGR